MESLISFYICLIKPVNARVDMYKQKEDFVEIVKFVWKGVENEIKFFMKDNFMYDYHQNGTERGTCAKKKNLKLSLFLKNMEDEFLKSKIVIMFQFFDVDRFA